MVNPSDFLLFIGMDPALQGDYFGVCIHALPKKKKTTEIWIPYLLKLFKLQATDYKAMWDALNQGVMYNYRNFYQINIDYTNEKTLADFLADKYGESRVVKTPFTKGEAGSKMQMAQSALQFLNSGYTLPDQHKITNPAEAENIKILKRQIISEEVTFNPDGSIKFKHKGAHNDLLHAWMLSLDIVRQYMLTRQGRTLLHVGGTLPSDDNTTHETSFESTSYNKMIEDWK